MITTLQRVSALALMALALLGQPFEAHAQSPTPKVTPDLLRIQQTNGAPVPSPVRDVSQFSGAMVENGMVAIEAVVTDGQNSTTLLQQLQALGLRNGAAYRLVVSGYLPIDKIDDLEAVDALRFARPVYEPIHGAGKVTSQGDRAMRADVARQVSKVTGAGSKVGILSDSYNALGGAPAGVASDDLPSNVQILDDLTSGTDEGRAMAEIVHDVAPGAAIAFNTANRGQAGFAQGIRALATAGCNVIVDDVSYFAEPFFQDGVIAQAVDDVTANGSVTYFSSAGNNARGSYQSTFKSAGQQTLPGYGVGTPHDFGGGDIYQSFVLPPNRQVVRIGFQWDDPFASVSGGAGAQTNMDILVYFNGTYLASLSGLTNNIGGDPFEFLGIVNNGTTPLTIDLVLVKKAGPDPNLVKWIFYGNGLTTTWEYNTNSSTIFGHANSNRVISVAAARYSQTPVYNTSLTSALPEGFTSLGGTPILFTTSGQRINGAVGITRNKPEITAPDGGNNTFFGGDYEGDGFPNFFGTSAAAPHAAGVAALMQQKGNNDLAPSSIQSLMQQTAQDMDNPFTSGFDTGFDFLTGYGLVQADRAVAAVGQPLALVQPIFNCQTGAITFQTTGGDGTPIEYAGIGITSYTTNPNQFLDLPVLRDPNSSPTVQLFARQSGRVVTFTFNFRTYCQNSGGNQPPVAANPIENQFARQGQFFDFRFPANTFTDPESATLTYSVAGLPNGLTFDAAARRISGTPTQSGMFPIIITATDPGGLSAQITFMLNVSATGTAQPLALIAPLYDCKTGAITFRTTGGDGTTITYFAIGIQRSSATDPNGVVEAGVRADPKPITITATQSGVTVSYTFDLAAACGATPPPSGFALIAPTYNCATGAITFQVTNVAAGKTVEFAAVGITGWSTNPNQFLDRESRTAGDVKPFTLRARYVGEPASEVTYTWTRPAPCSASARLGAPEPGRDLRITVLGNPTLNDQVEVNVVGAEGQPLHLRVSTAMGERISEQHVDLSGAEEHQRVTIGRQAGIYFLQVGTGSQQKTLKIVRQ